MVGDKIKNLRISQNKSQTDIAKDLNVSPQNISNWERNTSIPKLSELIKIANYFGVSTDYFLKEQNEIKTKEEKLKQVFKETGIMKGNNLTDEEIQEVIKQLEIFIKMKELERNK